MAERKRISLAIWGVPSSGYRQLLSKVKVGIAQPLISDNLRHDYYSVRFQADGYIVSRHFVGTIYDGLREGYRVFSIGVPYGYSLTNWENAFEKMEMAFKEALNGAENNLQIETNLSRSQAFDAFIIDWQLVEVQEQLWINVGTRNASKQGIVKYTESRDLEFYFRDPCRKAFDGYGIIYFTEEGSLAERKLAMQTILISEPAIHERKYSVTIEYRDATTLVKLGEKPAYPENVNSIKDEVYVKISETYYEDVELTGTLDDNEKWQIQRNDDGMGYTLVIALNPKVYLVKLVCDELDEKEVTDYSKYIKTNIGTIKDKEIILMGREKEQKICLSSEYSPNFQVEILQEDDDYIKFKFKRSFIFPPVNKKGCLSVLQDKYKMNISKVELHSSKGHKKLREIDLTHSEEIPGIPSDYSLVFVSASYENFKLSMVDYMNNNLPDKPVKKAAKACRIILEGEKVKSVLKKNPLTIECKKGKNERGTFTCDEIEYLLEIPEGETWNCVFKLKGYKPQSKRINFEEKVQRVTLRLTAARKSIFIISYVIKKWGIPFILGLLVGFFLGDTIQLPFGKEGNSALGDSAKYVDSYLEHQQDNQSEKLPIDTIRIVEPVDRASSEKLVPSNEEVVDNSTTFLADAAKYIELLGGIDFTAADINTADSFYKKNKHQIDSTTANLLKKKIKCAKEIIKACQQGFDYKSVKTIVMQEVVFSVYTDVQKEALQNMIDSGLSCSQQSGNSVREKLDKLNI